MALTRIKTLIDGQILTAADINNEIDNLINSSLSLISPLTGNLDFNGLSALNFGISAGGFRVAITHAATAARTLTLPDATGTAALLGTPALTLGTANAAGTASTAVRTDATLLAFDSTLPANVGTAATGSAAVAARRDHVHGGGGVTFTTGSQDIATTETTTSTSYTNLATSGPAVTLSPGSTTTHIISIMAEIGNNTSGEDAAMSIAIAGATAVDADAARGAADSVNNVARTESHQTIATAQTNGATHTAKYKVSAGTGTFKIRRLSAWAVT